ncbi:MAG: O-antigen ligase family protein, partial [Gammaproteobacteria bacterium]
LLLVSSRRRLRILAMTMVIGAMFQALFASLMVLGHWELPFLGRADVAHGTFINRNHLAGFLEMNLAVGIGLLIASLEPNAYRGSWRQRLRSLIRLMLSAKMRLRLYLVIMVIALVLTHSRMGNSAFLFSLLIAGGLALVLWRGAPRPVVILISSLILVDILIVGTWFGFDRVAKRLEETSLATEVRDEVDVYAFRLWQDFPLTGAGLGTFYAVFPRYRGEDAEGFFDHAHNDYLEILDEGGIIGLGLLGGAVVLSLAASVLAQARRRDPLLRGMGFAATMGIAALLIHSAVDFNLQIPANAATFMVVLALGWIAFGLRSRRAAGKPCV